MIKFKTNYPNFLTEDSRTIVYDLDIIESILNNLKKDFDKALHVNLSYSVKANHNIKIIKFLSSHNLYFDVSSMYEFEQVKKVSRNITATSPSFSEVEINELIDFGVKFDFDNLDQLKNISKEKVKGLRVKIPLQYNSENTYLSNSHFGINILENLEVLKEYQIERIHFHIGEIPSSEIVLQILKYIDDVLKSYTNIKEINIGGGLTSIYNNQSEWKHFVEMFVRWANSHSEIKFFVEPGMLIVGPSGFLVTKVLAINGNDIILDSSSWNLFNWYVPNFLLSTSKEEKQQTYRICGNSCYERDIFKDEFRTSLLSVGDKIIFHPVGGYVMSMKKNLHNFPEMSEKFYYRGIAYD